MRRSSRKGITLLEMIVAATIMTTVVTAAAALLRGAHTTWRVQQDDAERIEAAAATLRHIVRHVRQSQGVTRISLPSETSGGLSVTMLDSSSYVWGHVGRNKTVTFSDAGGTVDTNPLLAERIEQLVFTGYEADGVTQTTVAADIQAIECRVRVDLSRATDSTVWLSSWIWIPIWK